jgi:flagellar basal body-associated protein FliL
MSDAVADTPQKADQGQKRSLAKLLLLGVNLLLFLSGAGFFALTKFGMLNKPAAVGTTETPGLDAHDEPAPAKDNGHGKDKGHGTEAKPSKEAGSGKGAGHGGKSASKSAKKAEAAAELITVPLQPFVVNLSGDQGRRYLRLVLQLAVEGEDIKAEIDRNMAQVRDRLIFLFSGKTYDEVHTVQGKYQLQGEITKSLDELFREPVIERVYFTEFIVQ